MDCWIKQNKNCQYFFLIGFLVSLFQIILSLIINPYTLNKSRSLLRDTNTKQVNSIIKSNDFSDSFKGVTFYIDEKNSKKELINIFIKDSRGSINTVIGNTDDNMNTSIFAKKGMIVQNKLILFDGIIQTLNDNKKIKNINFEKTELSLSNFSTRTITQPKIQEISSYELFKCLNIENSQECVFKNNKKILIETLSRRAGMPLYIPLISIITSFLLIYKKEGKNNHTKKYIIFIFSFIVLILAEILLRYTGFSITNFTLYIFTPLILLIILYTVLIKKMTSKRFENE